MLTRSPDTSTSRSKVFEESGPTTKTSEADFNEYRVSNKWSKWKDRQASKELSAEELADSFYQDDYMGGDENWFGIEDFGCRD